MTKSAVRSDEVDVPSSVCRQRKLDLLDRLAQMDLPSGASHDLTATSLSIVVSKGKQSLNGLMSAPQTDYCIHFSQFSLHFPPNPCPIHYPPYPICSKKKPNFSQKKVEPSFFIEMVRVFSHHSIQLVPGKTMSGNW